MHRYPRRKRTYLRYHPTKTGDRSADAVVTPSPDERVSSILIPAPNSQDLAQVEEPALLRRRRIKKIVLIGGPLLVVAILAIIVMPTLLAAHRAYDQVFVPRMPHYKVVLNAQGTPVIDRQTGEVPNPTPTAAPTAASLSSATSVPIGTPEPSPIVVRPTPTVTLPTWDGTSRVNVLLIGSDSRGEGEIARSDTLILVTINPVTKQVSMLSIPRDLLVTIPNYGQDKINAAYAYGSMTNLTGPGLATATIEYNFGVTIDYFAEVDTTGLARIIDTLGGVTLDVPAPIKDDEYPGSGNNYLRVVFHTGVQHMDGVHAVQFARTRHDDSDFARNDRQQQLLRALRAQSAGLNLLPKAPDLLDQVGNTFQTDLSPSQVLSLAKLGASINSNDIHSYDLLDATSVSYSPGQPYYLIPNWPAIHKILNEMMSR